MERVLYELHKGLAKQSNIFVQHHVERKIHRLAAYLNTAFKWYPIFDLDILTFLSNILLYKQMFDH